MLQPWGMWSNPLLSLLPGPFWPGVVAPDRVLSMGRLELNSVLILNWIVWKITVLTFKLFAQSTGALEYTNSISAEGYDSPKKCSGYDTKQSNSDVPVMLELWGMWSTPLLLSLPSLLWPGVVASDRVLSMCQIELGCNYAKLNCLKLNWIGISFLSILSWSVPIFVWLLNNAIFFPIFIIRSPKDGVCRNWKYLREKYSTFLYSFHPEVRRLIQRLAGIIDKIGGHEMSVLFIQTYIYIYIHTHTHLSLILYIYIYIYKLISDVLLWSPSHRQAKYIVYEFVYICTYIHGS